MIDELEFTLYVGNGTSSTFFQWRHNVSVLASCAGSVFHHNYVFFLQSNKRISSKMTKRLNNIGPISIIIIIFNVRLYILAWVRQKLLNAVPEANPHLFPTMVKFLRYEMLSQKIRNRTTFA